MELVDIILASLVESDEYCRSVMPHMKGEYFDEGNTRNMFLVISDYFEKYNVLPSKEALCIEVENHSISQDDLDSTIEYITNIYKETINENLEYLIEKTEQFCKDRALYNALLEAVSIVDADGDAKAGMAQMSKDGIPDLMRTALSVSFDTKIGHNYIEEYDERYEYYHAKDSRLEFDINFLNKVTNNGSVQGLPRKTLTSLIGQPGAGKTLALIHFAQWYMKIGKNVLYISNEMSEYELSKRVDTNMMDVKISELMSMDKATYERRINKIKDKTVGKLIIKEYPTGSAHVGHYRHAINELKTLKNFVPDVIIVDYMNICASSRIKNTNANSYTIIKSVAEELRGMAIEYDVPVITANQPGRGAFDSSDMDMSSVADSIGVAYTLDLFIALITSDELRSANQLKCKIIKNRMGPVGQEHAIGVDYEKMRLFNVDQSTVYSSDENKEPKKHNTGSRAPVGIALEERKQKVLSTTEAWDFSSDVENLKS